MNKQTTIAANSRGRQASRSTQLRAWQKEALAITQAWGFVPNLRVSVTGECNMRCDFCHNEGGSKHSIGLSLAEYQLLAWEASAIGLRSVKLTGGDPMLREDLPEIVSAFRGAGFEAISLVTNGIALTRERQTALKSAGLQRVTVSVHTLKPEIYEQRMRTSARNLQETLVNLDHASVLFDGNLKLNTVFEVGGNYPGEVLKLVELTCYLKATLSVLSMVSQEPRSCVVSNGVREIIHKAFHVREVQTAIKRGVKVETLILQEGGAVELDDFRAEDAVLAKNTNAYCATCPLKLKCTEGPYALRITANGWFKPCLIRKDNEVHI